jgi:hypothetical protein
MGRAHRSPDVGDGGALIELADAEADQHGRLTRVARELAADGGPDATRVPGCMVRRIKLKTAGSSAPEIFSTPTAMSWLLTSGDSSTYSLVLEHLLLKTVDRNGRQSACLKTDGTSACTRTVLSLTSKRSTLQAVPPAGSPDFGSSGHDRSRERSRDRLTDRLMDRSAVSVRSDAPARRELRGLRVSSRANSDGPVRRPHRLSRPPRRRRTRRGTYRSGSCFPTLAVTMRVGSSTRAASSGAKRSKSPSPSFGPLRRSSGERGPAHSEAQSGLIRGLSPWRSRDLHPLETPSELLPRCRHASTLSCALVRVSMVGLITAVPGNAAQRGQPCRVAAVADPEQFPPSSGRNRRRLPAGIRSAKRAGSLPRVSGAVGTVLEPTGSSVPTESPRNPRHPCQGSAPRLSLCP